MNAFDLLDVRPVCVVAPPELVARMREALSDRSVSPSVEGSTEDEVLAAFAEVVPDAREHQAGSGIAPEITVETLRDVGSKHRVFGARTEVPWLLGILRGDVLSFGRLQVERRAEARGFGLHIPQRGPLTPDAVDASLARARVVLGAERFTCTSWLLDPVLLDALPQSNMAAFARRFALDPETVDASDAGARSAAKFVFARPLDEVRDPALVTPTTRLERLVAQRLRGGEAWAEPTGTFSLG